MSLRFTRQVEASTSIRRVARSFFRLTGIRSFVQSEGFWWYRWHSDAGIGFSEDWEKPIQEHILHPGSCFVDAGSHVGRWSIRASRLYERILAFEPDPFTNYVLRRNIARNDIRNILVFATALSDRRDKAVLFSYGPPACSSLRSTHISGLVARPGNSVQIRPLDDFTGYFLSPMILKIDVEGEELRVLEGATRTLNEHKPTIVMEVHFRKDLEPITELLKRNDYDIMPISPEGPNPLGQVYLVAKPSRL
jgi:FkbM family methyltransferase